VSSKNVSDAPLRDQLARWEETLAMHVVTKLLGVAVLIMIGAAITAFTSVLETPLPAGSFFTVRDLVEELVFPIVFAVANYRLYVYLRGTAPSKATERTWAVAGLAEVILLAGIVIASVSVGVRFVGDELTTNYCSGLSESAEWCLRAQFFHKELGHLGLFVGNILVALALLACQLSHGEAGNLKRTDAIGVDLLGGLCGVCLFALVVEGRIIEFGLPILATYAVATALAWRARRTEIRRLPVLSYQTIAAWIGLALVASWVLYWRGFPDFAIVRQILIH
jgi:hypothetical protein